MAERNNMKLVQGRIEALGRDSRGVLHVHFRKGWHRYELWAVDGLAGIIERYDQQHGALMEIAAKPIIFRFDEITDEIVGITFVDHRVD